MAPAVIAHALPLLAHASERVPLEPSARAHVLPQQYSSGQVYGVGFVMLYIF